MAADATRGLPVALVAILVYMTSSALGFGGAGRGATGVDHVPHNCSWIPDSEHNVNTVECIEVGLTSIPDDLPEMDILRVEYNDFMVLEGIPYPGLRFAYLDSNGIYSIADGAFSNMSKLVTLNLANNSLTPISGAALRGLTMLHILVLKGNPLYEISPGVLDSQVLPNLETLDMADCRVYEFSPQAFDRGSPLKTLNASNNRLTSLTFLRELKALHVLDLSFNRISSLPPSSFLGLSVIDDLHLAHNAIPHLQEDSLQGLTRLKKLTLSHNRLTSIDHSAFKHTPHLAHLDLSYNALVHLAQDRLPWGTLMSLLVHNNPWDCGCRTAWLRSSKVLLVNLERNLTCSSPAEVQGAAVYTINMSFFHCTDVAKRASERALAIGLGVVIGLIIAMIATLVVYRLVFKARRRARDGTLTVSASSPYSRVDSRELVLKGDDI